MGKEITTKRGLYWYAANNGPKGINNDNLLEKLHSRSTGPIVCHFLTERARQRVCELAGHKVNEIKVG